MNNTTVKNLFKIFVKNTSKETWAKISTTESILKMTPEMREAWLAVTAMSEENLIGLKTYRGVIKSVKWTFAECDGYTVKNPPIWANAVVTIGDHDFYWEASTKSLFEKW